MVRRLLAAVSVGTLLVAGLAACRMDPSVAAYIGDTRYTIADVDRVYDEVEKMLRVTAEEQREAARERITEEYQQRQEEIPEDLLAELDAPVVLDMTLTKQRVVETMVFGEVAKRLATEEGYPVEPISAADVAQVEQVPEDSEYARLRADMATYLVAIAGQTALVEPTDADLRDIYERARRAGEPLADEPYEAVRDDLNNDQIRQVLGVRAPVLEAAAQYDITVNPRFRPLEYPLLSFQGGSPAVTIPLGEPADVVRDAAR